MWNINAVVSVWPGEMSDSVGMYLNQIGLVPLLTAAEEVELAQTIEREVEAEARRDAAKEAGKKLSAKERREIKRDVDAAAAARDRFIRANLRLVVSIARRYPLPPTMELLDLIQEGNLGLEHAVEKFDWRKGFKFSTYATFWIRQSIGRALDQKASLVRIPSDRSAGLRARVAAVKRRPPPSSTTKTHGSTASAHRPRSIVSSATTAIASWSI